MCQDKSILSNDDEFTLSLLFKILKKSFLSSFLSVLFMVIAILSILFTARIFTERKTYLTTLSFSTAKEDLLCSMNSIKSEIVGGAIKGKDPNKIADLLKINAVTPKTEEPTESNLPSSFTITLYPDKKLKFTDDDYLTILNDVSTLYVKKFSIGQMPELEFNESQTDVLNFEYMQVANDLLNTANSFLNELQFYLSTNPQVKNYQDSFSKMSIKNVTDKLEFSIKTLNEICSYVILNKVEKVDGAIADYLTLMVINATALCNKYSNELSDAKEIFTTYSSIPTFQKHENGITYVTFDNTLYNELWENIKIASNKLAVATEEKERAIAYKSNLTDKKCTDEDINFVVQKLSTAKQLLSSAVKDYTVLKKGYNIYPYLTSEITIVSPPKIIKNNYISNELLVILPIFLGILTYITSVAKYYSKQKNKL